MKSKLLITFCILFLVNSAQAEVLVYSKLTGNYWQIWAHDLETNKEQQLTNGAGDKREPRCTHDGSTLYFRNGNAELYRRSINDLEAAPERVLSSYGMIMDYKLSPDASRLAFTRMRSDLLDDSDLWVINIDGSEPRQITNEIGLQYHVLWKGESSLIYVSPTGKSRGDHLWLRPIDGDGKPQELTSGTFYDLLPALSRDGQSVVFSSNRNGSFDIWQFQLSNNALKQLTRDSGLETSPTYSSDGKIIYFVSTKSGDKQLWAFDMATGEQKQLTSGQPLQEPSVCAGYQIKETE